MGHWHYITKDTKTETDSLRKFLMLHLHKRLAWSHKEIAKRPDEYERGEAPSEVLKIADCPARIIML